ncbi:Concanavalin A-like lectin/glucanase, subgroup [Plasmopara halstedii]|uniref:Concanavalin A-like lectin/glucanase, subgroup n=1 Tax=Plasmopara halstedii TaxID=4781 RepID=A0A0P1AH73_PLAHL|nr:Concanavalin A-like lectin/glucanase, subgroup [Plasmopara halstedii]CEG40460.1 Concanavalin A-like lectin/glucanase, subgroup [Plasmopara halstedii]|eukprot:XP_024576829.1 Concanavalin A-like lectin/glucanase, subgroup [Plasmopara halstedii]
MQVWPIFLVLLPNIGTFSNKVVEASLSKHYWASGSLSYALLTAVDAVKCAEICYTAELTGFGPGGTPGCTCSGSQQGARTGFGSCSCGQCYEKTQGVVYGFAIDGNGICTYGTDCGTCDFSTGSSTNVSGPAVNTPTPAPITPAPSPPAIITPPPPVTSAPPSIPDASTPSPITTSNSTSPSIHSTNSTSLDDVRNNTGNNGGSSEEHSNTLSTWQIVLVVCCVVLIFIVAFVAVCTCYCKARNRLYENEDDHTSYYVQNSQTFQLWTSNNTTDELIASKRTSVAV